ncbi:MAG: hypothetical protein JWO91_2033 [Acidobacteriaceae bacterium]|nr:hypothetical protein [Acidobacteriaceae bacterium]
MSKTLMLGLALLLSATWLQAQSQYPHTGSSEKGASNFRPDDSTGLPAALGWQLYAD